MQNILVIDDDPSVRELTRQLLHTAGYKVETASNGRDGLRLLAQQPYDLVISDMLMPEMEGLELLLECRHLYPDQKMIAMSGGLNRGAFDALPAAHALGALEVLYKPFKTAQLLEMVKRVLGDEPPAS